MSFAGRYRIVRRLGAGGMAEVLEAQALGDAGFVRRVAIKRMLGTALEDPAFSRMFLDEARIASSLHHANIVSVLDYGVVDGAPFQVLELVDGIDARTLLRHVEDDRLPVDVALYVAAQIGHALAAAHDGTNAAGEPLGVVHRDVSPGNILVSWAGDVKLADFGIAFAKDRAEKTEVGMTKGTLLYMSPEQATTGRVDPRSDIFSLGCVLHTLVTGVSPLAKDGFTRCLSEMKTPLAPDLPEDVGAIIEIATRFLPEQRFRTAGAMTEALGSALARRLGRDPRRRLVEYLAPVRERITNPARPRGKLDDLLQIDIVLAPGEEGAATRTFLSAAPSASTGATEFDPTVVAMGDPTIVTPGVNVTMPSEGAPASSLRRSHAVPAAIAATALVALTIVGAIFALRTRRAEALVTVSTRVAVPSAVVPSSPPAPEPVAVPVTPAPSAVAPAPTAIERAPVVQKPAPNDPRPKKVTPAPSATANASCTGTIYLSCPLAPRATVSIDGAPTGHHHGEFVDVPCASHAVAFLTEDGRRATRSASPTSANTRTSPVEVRCGLE